MESTRRMVEVEDIVDDVWGVARARQKRKSSEEEYISKIEDSEKKADDKDLSKPPSCKSKLENTS